MPVFAWTAGILRIVVVPEFISRLQELAVEAANTLENDEPA